MVGRLKPGTTAAQSQSDAERVARETMSSYPAFMSTLRIRAVVPPLHEDTVEQARPLIRTLFFAVAVVLLRLRFGHNDGGKQGRFLEYSAPMYR